MENTALIHRLNRAIGQIEAIKRGLAENQPKDCVKTLRLLKASSNALKKFGEAYVKEHLNDCMAENVDADEIAENLQEVIETAFSL